MPPSDLANQARNERTTAAWAKAHETAAGRYPADECPRFFTDLAGANLLQALHEAAIDPDADLDAIVDQYIPRPDGHS